MAQLTQGKDHGGQQTDEQRKKCRRFCYSITADVSEAESDASESENTEKE